MEETKDARRIVGSFVGRYICFAIIIGGISFVLENVIPEIAHWKFNVTRIIFQSVLFVISTILTIVFATRRAFKEAEIPKEDVPRVTKPIKVLLILIAIMVMGINLLYCYKIEQSGYKDVENKYETYEARTERERELCIAYEKEEVHLVSNIYLGTKEILTILTYSYAVIYVEKMIECRKIKK